MVNAGMTTSLKHEGLIASPGFDIQESHAVTCHHLSR